MECMLFFIEVTQFQNYLIQNDEDSKIDNNIMTSISLGDAIFAENIPISEIVQFEFEPKNDKIYGFKMKAYKIYKKYIEVGSEFEINISAMERSKLAYIANLSSFLQVNTDINDFLIMFEECKKAMRLLLMYSLTRLKLSPEFKEIEQIFDKSIQEEIVVEEIPTMNYMPANSNSIKPTRSFSK